MGRWKDGLAFCWCVRHFYHFLQGLSGSHYTGPDAPGHISSMEMDGDSVWIASGPLVIKYIRGKEVLDLGIYYFVQSSHAVSLSRYYGSQTLLRRISPPYLCSDPNSWLLRRMVVVCSYGKPPEVTIRLPPPSFHSHLCFQV